MPLLDVGGAADQRLRVAVHPLPVTLPGHPVLNLSSEHIFGHDVEGSTGHTVSPAIEEQNLGPLTSGHDATEPVKP